MILTPQVMDYITYTHNTNKLLFHYVSNSCLIINHFSFILFSGRILNRFSKDIGALDELLPRFLLESIQIYLVMFSILALNAAALVWTLLPTTIILLLFYVILQIYLKSAQSIKRLEGTSTYKTLKIIFYFLLLKRLTMNCVCS